MLLLIEDTNSTLCVPQGHSARSASSDGVYSVDVVNGSGSVTSSNATLHVINPPSAVNDSYNVLQDRTLAVPASGVLANDVGFNSLLLTAVVAGTPRHGTLALSVDGSFTYVPAAGWYGNDSFSYTATDGLTTSDPATVRINVLEIISAPLTLSAVGMTTNGFKLKLSGPSPADYIVFASDGLSNWVPIWTNSVVDGSTTFTDRTASNWPNRFYKAVAQTNW